MVMASSRSGTTLLFLMCAAVLLLVFAAYSSTARPDPIISSSQLPHQVVEETQTDSKEVGIEERCEEGVNEDECLMRRTLVAHIDYIYTQNHKH